MHEMVISLKIEKYSKSNAKKGMFCFISSLVRCMVGLKSPHQRASEGFDIKKTIADSDISVNPNVFRVSLN